MWLIEEAVPKQQLPDRPTTGLQATHAVICGLTLIAECDAEVHLDIIAKSADNHGLKDEHTNVGSAASNLHPGLVRLVECVRAAAGSACNACQGANSSTG